jgi:hypothetical protein
MTAAWENVQRSLPKAPNVDVTQIRGNISDAEKQIGANFLVYGTTGSGVLFPPFANEVGGRLQIVELNVWHNVSTGSSESEVVLEIQVTKSEDYPVLNWSFAKHGGFIVQVCPTYTAQCTAAARPSLLTRKPVLLAHMVSTNSLTKLHRFCDDAPRASKRLRWLGCLTIYECSLAPPCFSVGLIPKL